MSRPQLNVASGAGSEDQGSSQVRAFLIADVRGYTRFVSEHGDAAGAKLASRFATLADEVVSQCDGAVIEVRGDEVLCVFSSPRQALRAGTELQQRLRHETDADPSLPLRVGVGLDAGEAVPVDGGFRGKALNVAARLCSLAAAGEVLATDEMTHLAGKVEHVGYVPRGTMQLKGLADLVDVMQIVEAAATETADEELEQGREHPPPIGGFLGALPSNSLVGRASEFERIVSAIEAVADGKGRLVLLAGEPGVGKTRLAQEITLNVRNRGFRVASGICYEPQEGVPFYPFLEAIGSLYRQAPAALRRDVPRRWPYLAALLPNEGLPAAPGVTEGQEEQQRLFWSVTSFIQSLAAEQPLALLLDDLHWCDATSLSLLQHLARHTRSDAVLLLATYRDVEVGRQHPLEQFLRDLQREHLAERLVLQRLPEEETAQLIASVMGEQEVSAEFRQLIHKHAQGNPFFTEEVLRALVERGDVYREDGHWEKRDIEQIVVPESIRSVVGERLSRLNAEAQEVLQEASILGSAFTFEELQALGDRDERVLERALEEASGAALVIDLGKDDYSFNHSLTQQTLYGELSSRRRRRLHLAAGQALERLPEPKRDERASEIARHFLEADDPERSLTYALIAARQAAAVFAHVDAERHYRMALELSRELGDIRREAESLQGLGQILHDTSRFAEADDALQDAIRLHRESGNQQGEWETVAFIATADPAKGAERIGEVLEAAENAGESLALATLYKALSAVNFWTGRYEQASEAAHKAVAVAEAIGDKRLLAQARLRELTCRQTERADQKRGAEDYRRLVPLLEEVRDLPSLVNALMNFGGTVAQIGSLGEAESTLLRSLEVSRSIGNRLAPLMILSDLSMVCYWVRGEWDRAAAANDEALEMMRGLEGAWISSYVFLARAWLESSRGSFDEAQADLQQGTEVAQSFDDGQFLGHAAAARAEMHLARTEPEQAIAVAEEFASPRVWTAYRCLAPLAEAYLRAGRMSEAVQTSERAVGDTREQALNVFLVDALRVRGMVLSSSHRYPEAAEAFQEAIALARSMPYPYAEARALSEWGIMLCQTGGGEAGRERLETSRDIFRRLGALPYLERTEKLLQELR